MCIMTALWGGGVPTFVSDWSEPRLCRLLLHSYFPVPPDRPSHRQTYLQGRVLLLTCPPTPPIWPLHSIILHPGRPPSPSQNTTPASSHHGVLLSPQFMVYMLTGLWTGQYDLIMRWRSSKPQSGIATVLDSAAYCYVLIPHLPWYYSTCRSYHTRSFAHRGVTRLRTSISAYHTRSFAHPVVSRLHPRHSDFLLCTTNPLWLLLRDSLSLLPPTLSFLWESYQGGPNFLLCHLLAPPSLPTASTPLVALLPCTHFEYWQ